MKKATAILLSMIMIFSLTACSSKKTPSQSNTQKSSSGSTPKSEPTTDSSGQSATKKFQHTDCIFHYAGGC
jgi:hypothetical protein